MVPVSRKEGATRGIAWGYLLVGGAVGGGWVALGFAYLLDLGSPQRSFFDVFSNALSALAIGIGFVTLGTLHGLPANRHRAARLGARVAGTLSLLAVVPSFLLRFFDLGPNVGWVAVAIALAWIVLILNVNYFVNRRRARRSSRGVAA